MKGKKRVEHEGVVIEETEELYKVKIESNSACSSCHAKGLCSASEMQDKIIDVHKNRCKRGYKAGEKVVVELEQSLALKAVWIVYLPPIAILVTILLYLQQLNVSELYIGLIAVAVVALYFLFLYFFRGAIGKQFYFTIKD